MITRAYNAIWSTIKSAAEVLGTLSAQRRNRRYLILVPIFMMVALLLAIVSTSGALAPFIYPLF